MNKTLIIFIVILIMSLCSIAYARRSGHQPPHKPPQEAIDACSNKSETHSCDFVTPHGDTITGTCEVIQNQLACKPEGGPPPPSGQK